MGIRKAAKSRGVRAIGPAVLADAGTYLLRAPAGNSAPSFERITVDVVPSRRGCGRLCPSILNHPRRSHTAGSAAAAPPDERQQAGQIIGLALWHRRPD